MTSSILPHIEGCKCPKCYVWCSDEIILFGAIYVCQNENGHEGTHYHLSRKMQVEWDDKGISASLLEAAKLIVIYHVDGSIAKDNCQCNECYNRQYIRESGQ